MNSTTDDNNDGSERLWYIRVSGTIYGPFDDRTVWTYVQEGRVTALSDLSTRPDDGYQAAKNWLEIAHWFQAPVPETPPQATAAPPLQPKFSSLMLIMAEIRSGRTMAFMQTLQSLGEPQKVGENVWLLQSNSDPLQLKSVLGPTLSVSDRLFVADATYSEYSAYNLGTEVDDKIKDIFAAQQL